MGFIIGYILVLESVLGMSYSFFFILNIDYYIYCLLPKFGFFYLLLCDQLTETGRVSQSAVIHCQIRLVYSKSGVIAYVRFTRATN